MFLPKIQVETIMQFELIVFALFFLEDTREVPMPQQFPHRGHLEEQGIVEFFDSKIQKASSPQNCTTNEGEEEEVFRTSPHLSGTLVKIKHIVYPIRISRRRRQSLNNEVALVKVKHMIFPRIFRRSYRPSRQSFGNEAQRPPPEQCITGPMTPPPPSPSPSPSPTASSSSNSPVAEPLAIFVPPPGNLVMAPAPNIPEFPSNTQVLQPGPVPMMQPALPEPSPVIQPPPPQMQPPSSTGFEYSPNNQPPIAEPQVNPETPSTTATTVCLDVTNSTPAQGAPTLAPNSLTSPQKIKQLLHMEVTTPPSLEAQAPKTNNVTEAKPANASSSSSADQRLIMPEQQPIPPDSAPKVMAVNTSAKTASAKPGAVNITKSGLVCKGGSANKTNTTLDELCKKNGYIPLPKKKRQTSNLSDERMNLKLKLLFHKTKAEEQRKLEEHYPTLKKIRTQDHPVQNEDSLQLPLMKFENT